MSDGGPASGDGWRPEIEELRRREAMAHEMGGPEKVARQHAAGRLTVREGREPAPMRHHALQVPPSVGDVTLVDERFVAAAHECGLAVHVWTIDDPEEMRRLVALGVDGVMTDRPSVLRQVTGGGS